MKANRFAPKVKEVKIVEENASDMTSQKESAFQQQVMEQRNNTVVEVDERSDETSQKSFVQNQLEQRQR